MSEITAIAKSTTCEQSGGVSHAYATDASNITAATIAAGVVTAITLAADKAFARLDFDDDENVAFFNEEGTQVGGRIEINGTSLMSFNGISQSKITAANQAKGCCGVVVIWVQYDGTRRVQGIDVAPGETTWQFSKTRARIIPTINSGTGAENALVQYAVSHVGLYASPTTDLTDTEIEAL